MRRQRWRPGFRCGTGYLTKIKERNSDDFVWMSRDAGADVKRVRVAGGTFIYGKFSLGAITYYSHDFINIFYIETKYGFPITKEIGILLGFQFAGQRSL